MPNLIDNAKVVAFKRGTITCSKQWSTFLHKLIIDGRIVFPKICLAPSGKPDSTIDNQNQILSKKNVANKKDINKTNCMCVNYKFMISLKFCTYIPQILSEKMFNLSNFGC